MTKLLLSIHVVAAIVAIGPVTVTASMFPAFARRGAVDALPVLHRICRVYAAVGVVVPVFGLATASSLGVLTDPWLLVSIVLTGIAAVVLLGFVLPGQARMLAAARAQAPGAGDRSALPAAPDSRRDMAMARDGESNLRTGRGEQGQAGAPSSPAHHGEGEQRGIPEQLALGRRLGMVTGVFNLLWVVVVVLMIVRPGSTTGV